MVSASSSGTSSTTLKLGHGSYIWQALWNQARAFLLTYHGEAGSSLLCAAEDKLVAEGIGTCLTSQAGAGRALDSVYCGGAVCHRQRQRPGRRNLLLRLCSEALSSGNQTVLRWWRSAERDPCCPSWLLFCRSVDW